jgi:hypothetical protein
MDLLELHHRGTVGIVTRRVARSPDVVDLVLALGGSGLPPFRPLPAELRSWGWRAEARLPGRHHVLVTVELTAWSSTTTELRLAPAAALGLGWSDRRWDRYFATAHAVATAMVETLETTPTGLPASPPLAAPSGW